MRKVCVAHEAATQEEEARDAHGQVARTCTGQKGEPVVGGECIFKNISKRVVTRVTFHGGIPNRCRPPLPRLSPLGRGDVAGAHAPPGGRRFQDRVARGTGGGGRAGPTRDAWPPPPPVAPHPGAGAMRRWRCAAGASPAGGAGATVPTARARRGGVGDRAPWPREGGPRLDAVATARRRCRDAAPSTAAGRAAVAAASRHGTAAPRKKKKKAGQADGSSPFPTRPN